MKYSRMMCAVLAMGLSAGHVDAALSVNILSNTGDAPAGQVSNDLTANSDFDVIAAEIFITLDTGTLYNNNALIPGLETFGQTPGDTFVSINNDPNTLIAGAAGDLGHNNLTNPGGAEFGPTVLGVTWGNTSFSDIGSGVALGTFSFSADASGSGQMIVTHDQIGSGHGSFFMDLTVVNGVLTPEPTTLGLLGMGGLALLKKRRR